ncbi:MAG: CAP domain-containing protein [Acidobacteriota bacterium]
MEKGLLLLLNRERTSRNLPALRLSPEISRVARAHSAEMARGGALSHESADGKSPSDRLSEAAIDFSANGENVGYGNKSSVDIIHQTFMDSRGHRENCLNPEFNEVGIGVAPGPGGSWYITEDFIHGVTRLAAVDVRALVLRALDESRARSGRPAMVQVDELDRTAQAFAEAKAAGRKLPSPPDFFGETLVRFTRGPVPSEIASSLGNTDLLRYGRAGIGVRFDRSAEYPGGGYTVCVLVVADNASPTPDDLERLLTVLGAANAVRAQAGLPRLDLDHDLCREADLIIRRQQGESIGVPRPHGRYDYFARTWHLDTVDKTLRARLAEAGFRRIGISTVPYFQARNGRPNPVANGFAVTVILDR